MMSFKDAIDDNAPRFAVHGQQGPLMMAIEQDEFYKLINDRPSLRDQFAMAALTGLLSKSGPTTNFSNDARNAYLCADAMLKQREKG